MRVYVDHTHLWRPVTGLERITLELFSPAALAPLDVRPVRAGGMPDMLYKQMAALPAALLRAPSALVLCPGFPPTPLLQAFASRVIPYIHDVFLLSRRDDLNWRARTYMARPFALAVRRLPRFLVNSADTARKLRAYCRDDAELTLYRPAVRNAFNLRVGARAARRSRPGALQLVALGTVEPRKNLVAAARILGVLRAGRYPEATLDIVGRQGWGDDWAALAATPGVTLHGYRPDAEVTDILERADALISTSHEEGLGLPLLEAQYAGLPVIAPDQPVFHEVLEGSGIFIDPGNPATAAQRIAAALAVPDWRAAFVDRGVGNLRRWNALAAADRGHVVGQLQRLGGSERAAAARAWAEN